MSRPHENDENDVPFSMKTQTFENALQSPRPLSFEKVEDGGHGQESYCLHFHLTTLTYCKLLVKYHVNEPNERHLL